MPQRFSNPVIKYTTDTLKTLPGALLYFYENGTSTPKVVYQNIELTTPHAHPVVADSAGVFAPIFLDGTYRVELKSAAGITQTGWPVDNVGGEEIQGQFDSWSAVVSYTIGRLVTGSDGNRYESTANSNLNRDPTNPANRTGYWKQVFIIGEYVSTETYGVGDYITHDGGLFKCFQIATGQNPQTAHAYWQRIHNLPHWGSTATYRHYDLAIDSNGAVVVSQQNNNLNHNPVGDTAYTWWKPLNRVIFDANPQLFKTNTMAGGGTLKAEWCNMLTDGNAGYLLPLANTVPSDTCLVIAKSDIARTLYPIVTASGADTIRWLGGTDTSFQIDTQWADSMILYSNGTNQWSF